MNPLSTVSTDSTSTLTDFVGAIASANGYIEWLALALAIYSCWRTHRVKSLDLRVELRKCRNEAREKHRALQEFMNHDKSRQRVSMAEENPGTADLRHKIVEKDEDELERLLRQLPDERSISSVRHKVLEEKLDECHMINLRLDNMLSKRRDAPPYILRTK